jgi:hypothetical protein
MNYYYLPQDGPAWTVVQFGPELHQFKVTVEQGYEGDTELLEFFFDEAINTTEQAEAAMLTLQSHELSTGPITGGGFLPKKN